MKTKNGIVIKCFFFFTLAVFILREIFRVTIFISELDFLTILFFGILTYLFVKLKDNKDMMNKTGWFLLRYFLFSLTIYLIKIVIFLIDPTMLGGVFPWIIAITFIFLVINLLKEYKEHAIEYRYVIFVVLIFPVTFYIISIFLAIVLGLTIGSESGLLRFINVFDALQFKHIFYPGFLGPFLNILNSSVALSECLDHTAYNGFSSFIFTLFYFIFTDFSILSVLILFHFTLFYYFKQNNINPYLCFIPVVKILMLAKVCNVPTSWKILLFVPVIRLYYFYKINLILTKGYNLSKLYIIGMTLLPYLFYGILIYKEKSEINDPLTH